MQGRGRETFPVGPRNLKSKYNKVEKCFLYKKCFGVGWNGVHGGWKFENKEKQKTIMRGGGFLLKAFFWGGGMWVNHFSHLPQSEPPSSKSWVHPCTNEYPCSFKRKNSKNANAHKSSFFFNWLEENVKRNWLIFNISKSS